MIEHITDHEARGVALLIERYRKPLISALLQSWLAEVQAIEDALYQLLTQRGVANAIGAQLDVLGRIVNQPRAGTPDATYRIYVLARQLVSRSSGQVSQLSALAQKLLSVAWNREEYYPASQIIRALAPLDVSVANAIASMFVGAKGAGVGTQFVFWSGPGAPFTFAPGASVVSGSPYGIGAGTFAAATDGRVPVGFTIIPVEWLLTDGTLDPLTFDGTGDNLVIG